MSPRPASSLAYARAIERALSAARGTPVVVSERDFALIARWHERGVPLAIVLDVLRAVQARGRAPRSLAYLAPAVEDAWRALADGRTPPDDARPAAAGAEAAWRARRDALEPGSPLRSALDDALARLARGHALDDVDAALDGALASAAPRDLVAACEAEAARALAAYRRRMAPAVFERTKRRAVADRLRDALGLPRGGRDR